MNVLSKLRLIQEGYSIEDINSGQINPIHQINETSIPDEYSLITESLSIDINYITEMSLNMLQENDSSNKSDVFKKFIAWIVEKIRQFKIFIMNLFKKKKEEIIKTYSVQLKKIENKEFKPFMVSNILEKIINSPDEAIKILKELVENFEDKMVDIIDVAYKGFNDEIKETTNINELQIIVWKKIMSHANISYDHGVTKNVIDKVLNMQPAVRIHSKDQINNIIIFANNFYDLWKDMNDSLTYYEGQLQQLGEFDHGGFKITKLSCETMLQTFPEILRIVDGYIRKLTFIEKYID